MADKITALKKKTISVPAWEKLEKEYDQSKHPVMCDPEYVDKVVKGKTERVTRITLGWQKLAVKRMKALLCGIPVRRVYNAESDQEKTVAAILEDIYKRNRIDAMNLDRAGQLYASCEAVTIWYGQEQATTYAGQNSKLKLRCRTYSPLNGDRLYPLFDEYDDLVALSVEYTRQDGDKKTTYFDTYTDRRHVCYNVTEGTEILNEEHDLGKIPGVYIHRDEPVWEKESKNVYEAEWTYSRNGNYLRKNSRPTIVLFTDNKVKGDKAPKGDDIARDVVRLAQGDDAKYLTWDASTDALRFHIEELKHNFYSQLQLPDVSMDNMKSSPMSGESRKMLFMDAQMKVTGEQGAWLEFYDREFNVVKAYAKTMFPGMAAAIDALTVEHILTPYQIRDEKERVETLTTATGNKPVMSQLTGIKRLGWVDDAEAEMEQIEKESVIDILPPAE